MMIDNHFRKTPEVKTTKEIPDKFGFWFANNLPEFFYGGVTLRQIANAMPKKLFKEWCELNDIIYYNQIEGKFVEVRKGGKDEKNNQRSNV
jgi:hypothetical protein|tara:strand:+ start:735 stop:1007 length:273 start_codon:yes stop_codon:yes gene_type:complete